MDGRVIVFILVVFVFNDPATTEIYPYCHTLSLHDAVPISSTASRPPISNCDRPEGASPKRAAARSKIACVASAVSGVFSDGFHTTLLPHTSASAALGRKSTRLNSSH